MMRPSWTLAIAFSMAGCWVDTVKEFGRSSSGKERRVVRSGHTFTRNRLLHPTVSRSVARLYYAGPLGRQSGHKMFREIARLGDDGQ